MENSTFSSTYLENANNLPMVYSDQVFVYTTTADTRKYSHHPFLAFFNGRLYAMWSSGHVNEDDIEQGVVVSESEDFFHWEEPRFLVESHPGYAKEQPAVATAGGFYVADNRLIAYFGAYDFSRGEYTRKDGQYVMHGRERFHYQLFAMQSTDGMTFTSPENLEQPCFFPNFGPQRLRSGRLYFCGGPTHLYSDNPEGIGGFRLARSHGTVQLETIQTSECSYNYMTFPVTINKRSLELCEASFIETDDNALHMLYRATSDKIGILYQSVSHDEGETWSDITETRFSDSGAKFHTGRLPDGRFYYVGNPALVTDQNRKRIPLVISLSENGYLFDKHYILGNTTYVRRFYGRAKGGIYGYPHSIVHGAHLYVICSVCKEDVTVFRVRLKDL